MDSLTVDDLRFEVRRSPRRTSMQITVDRGGELVLSAPQACPERKMEEFVREKRFWIFTKLAEKEAWWRDARVKQYVSGEGFPYLGRSYRLLLVDDQDVPVRLAQGRFMLRRPDADEGRRHMVAWYTLHGRLWLTRRVQRYQKRLGVEPEDVAVRDLGYRWGSCGKGRKLYFHWRSILLPPRIVDYIVVHELVHLLAPHHTPEFWKLLERTMPDFALRKQWLAEHAHLVDAV